MDIEGRDTPPITNPIHAKLIQNFEEDADSLRLSLLDLALKLQQVAGEIRFGDNKLSSEYLSREYFREVQKQVQATLKKYEYVCQSQAYVQNVLEYSDE